MTGRVWAAVLAAVMAVAALAGCGSNGGDYFAATICVDQAGYRVPDGYCPIGDGIVNEGGFHWAYDEYDADDDDVDVVLVGYPVDRTRYVDVRPARVPTINLDRGRFPERAAPGATSTSVKVETVAATRKDTARSGSSTVTRGGLGVATDNRAATVPVARDGDSPAPGRNGEARTRPLPRADPPPPAKRAVATPSSKTRTTSKTTK